MTIQGEGYPVHVRAFSELLIRLRSDFGNDLDQALLLAVIAERHCDAPKMEDAAAAREHCAINAHSVALCAGIPRKSARRKVARLVRQGWVDCDPAGNLSPTAKAAEDLANATAASVSYLIDVTQIEPSGAAPRRVKETA